MNFHQSLRSIDKLATSNENGQMPSVKDAGEHIRMMSLLEANPSFLYSTQQQGLPDGLSIETIGFFELFRSSFGREEIHHFRRRPLCLAPRYSEPGDVIAIVSRCPCPLVIRPHPEHPSCWMLIGAACTFMESCLGRRLMSHSGKICPFCGFFRMHLRKQYAPCYFKSTGREHSNLCNN